MELRISSHSYYPKIGEKPGQHKLRKALHLFDHKKITVRELHEAYEDTVRMVLREQLENDLDLITDGLIWWNDPISHLLRQLEGIQMGGLLRFFDTNFYFRQPIITGRIKRNSSCLKEEAAFLRREVKVPTKAVLTGPYTLALLSKIETDAYKSTEEVMEDLTDCLVEEVLELSDLGIRYIQIDEPALLVASPPWEGISKALKKMSMKKGEAKMGLALYFGDVEPIYSQLQSLPVDFLVLDCTYNLTLLKLIEKEGSSKELSLGLLDGRNTKLEDPKEIVRLINPLKGSLKKQLLHITTSCGLEYLPRDKAFEKLKLLKTIKRIYK